MTFRLPAVLGTWKVKSSSHITALEWHLPLSPRAKEEEDTDAKGLEAEMALRAPQEIRAYTEEG